MLQLQKFFLAPTISSETKAENQQQSRLRWRIGPNGRNSDAKDTHLHLAYKAAMQHSDIVYPEGTKRHINPAKEESYNSEHLLLLGPVPATPTQFLFAPLSLNCPEIHVF